MSQKEISDLLNSLGLQEYTDTFIRNGVDLAMIGTLSGDDLKELGVTSLGHRKTILAAIQTQFARPASPSASEPGRSSPAPREEQTYLETEVAIINGSVATVKITSRRAVLGDKTYSLQNIAAVEVWSNAAEMEGRHQLAMQAWKLKNGTAQRVVNYAFAVVCFGTSIWALTDNNGGAAGCCGLVGLGAIIAARKTPPPPQKPPSLWSVRIQASGTSNDVIQSTNKEKIEEIVKALNEAIINLNM